MSAELSVIIPVYNAADYINQAIDSVLNQQGVFVEVIVVNDGSTDHTLSQLTSYGENVSIYTIPHSGPSEARNFGLRKAKGQYVMFLDADDYLSDINICHQCIMKIQKDNLEWVLFSFQYLNNKTGKFTDIQSYSKTLEEVTDCGQLFYQMIKTGSFPASPCFKVIKRDLLYSKDLFFIGEIIAEDVEWFVRLIIETTRFAIINRPVYIYRKFVLNSITFSMDIEKCEQFFLMIVKSLESIEKVIDENIRKALYASMAYEYCVLIGNTQNVSGREKIVKDLKNLSWLLEYDLFPRIRFAKWLYRLCGYQITSCVFALYIRYFSKSNQ